MDYGTSFHLERTALEELLDSSIGHYPIVYVCDYMQCGKTSLIRGWLEKRKWKSVWHAMQSPDQGRAVLRSALNRRQEPGNLLLVLDDLHNLRADAECLEMIERLVEQSVRMILISRAALPRALTQLLVQGQLREIGPEHLRFSPEETHRYLEGMGLRLPDADVAYIHDICLGQRLGLFLLARRIKAAGGIYSIRMIDELRRDLYDCFDQLLPPAIHEFDHLLSVTALFDQWDADLLSHVLPGADSESVLEALSCLGLFLESRPAPSDAVVFFDEEPDVVNARREYHYIPIFRNYLRSRYLPRLSEAERRDCLNRAAAHLESHDDVMSALDCYERAKNRPEMLRILEENATLPVCRAHYYEMRPWYEQLTDAELAQSTLLTSGMCILYSLYGQLDRSEEYLHRLQAKLSGLPRDSAEYLEVQRALITLQLALPHMGSGRAVAVIRQMDGLMHRTGARFPQFSISGNMPSLMNGGQDFCSWARYDRLLQRLLGPIVERVFGQCGASLPHVAVAESLYEKGDLDNALAEVSRGVDQVQRSTINIEMLFVARALKAKIMLAQGDYEAALRLVENTKSEIRRERATFLVQNMEAFEVWVRLHGDDRQRVDGWLARYVDDDVFRLRDRYCMMIACRVYIRDGQYARAELLLNKLLDYATQYRRPYIQMEAMLLKSIVLFHRGQHWRETFDAMLHMAQHYSFVRIIANEGAAVYPLISEVDSGTHFVRHVKIAVMREMQFYPNYLRCDRRELQALTDYEREVLQYVICGMNNREIAEQIHVSSHTVKYHLSHIYTKLGVKNRTELVKVALENGIA